jgi:hypothetical protein
MIPTALRSATATNTIEVYKNSGNNNKETWSFTFDETFTRTGTTLNCEIKTCIIRKDKNYILGDYNTVTTNADFESAPSGTSLTYDKVTNKYVFEFDTSTLNTEDGLYIQC